MEIVLNLFARGHLTQDQACVALAFIVAPEDFALRAWEEEFLRAVLIDQIGIEAAEKRFSLPSRSAKVILRQILQHNGAPIRPCRATRAVSAFTPTEGILLLAQEASNDDLKWIARFGFTPLEARMFDVLLSSKTGVVAKPTILQALYASRAGGDVPDARILDSLSCKIRAKIAGSPFELVTVPGLGYEFRSSFSRAPVALKVDYWDAQDLDRLCGRDPDEILKLATEFGFSSLEARLVAVLKNAMSDPTPKSYIMAAMTLHDPEADYFGVNGFDMTCCKIHRKLEPFGGGIRRLSGGGVVLQWPAEAWQ